MPPKNQPPDATISRNAIRQLSNRGLRSPCDITVNTRNGEVTLSGHVLYPHQRDAAVQALRAVEGVRRVTDQLKVKPPVKHQYNTLPPLAAPAKKVEATAATDPAATDPAAADQATETAPPVGETSSNSTEFELGPLPVIRPGGPLN